MSEGSSGWDALYQEAEALAAAGHETAARQSLKEALRLNDRHMAAWALLARLAQSPREEIFCLRRVVHIDPQQQWARQRLDALSQSSAESTPPRRPPARPTSKPPPAAEAQRKSRRLEPATLFFLTALLMFFVTCLATSVATIVPRVTPAAESVVDLASLKTPSVNPVTRRSCEALIAAAVRASDQGCGRLGANQACYGNDTLQAQLAAHASTAFEQRGDIIGIDALIRLDASPLNLDTNEWGIAIFKLVANLPRTLPGDIVTFIVFGDTTVDNASGNMQAFYFDSHLGQMTCESAELENGLFIHMPEGSGMVFSANGAEFAVMGTAALRAHRNEEMTISIVDGTASITAAGQTAYLAAGQQVQVPLGGADGLNPAGPPSDPVAADAEALALSCALTGSNCGAEAQAIGDLTQAFLEIAQALATATSTAQANAPTPSPSATPTGTRSRTATAGPSATASASPTRTTTGTQLPTATETNPPSPTRTAPAGATASASPTQAIGATATWSASASFTHTRTVSPTHSATLTATRTLTRTATSAPTATPTPSTTGTPTSTVTPTPTPTPTPSSTSTPTTTTLPPPTDTPSPTATSSPTPDCTALGAGSPVISGTTIDLQINNMGAGTVTISAIKIDWPDVPVQQKVEAVRFGGVQISSPANDPNSPTTLPDEISWSSGDRSLAGSSGKTLRFEFSHTLSGSATISVTFDNGCTLNAGP